MPGCDQQYKCRVCGWVGTERDMLGSYYDSSGDRICPSCETEHVSLSEYEKLDLSLLERVIDIFDCDWTEEAVDDDWAAKANAVIADIKKKIEHPEVCKTCKHWKPWDHKDVLLDPRDSSAEEVCEPMCYETFEKVDQGFEVRVCAHPERAIAKPLSSPSGFGVDVSEEYGYETAYLVTGENFGCVLHEEKG